MKKIFVSTLAILGVVTPMVFVYRGVFGDVPQQPEEDVVVVNELSPTLERIFNTKIEEVSSLMNNERLIAVLKESNEKNVHLTKQEIDTLDLRWESSGRDGEFVQEFLNNEIALIVKEFQSTHEGFSEVFVTDAIGLNVGQTNKTTDYYQADETWWQGAYNNGVGRAYHGPIEFDESSMTHAISVYVPVYEDGTPTVLGIVKAVIDLKDIQKEL